MANYPRGALEWLEDFLKVRFAEFGPFEDAISTRSRTVFHSVLSPLMNLGLLTPDEVVSRAVEYAEQAEVPLQSVEGFVRQIIGWREFIRGVYQNFDDKQSTSNHFDHQRELTDDWYRGTTGIPPLDDTIRTALELGWTHHIPRLMVAANLMTLAEIHPQSAWRWFMEMYVDSSEWVMGPNVFGMGLFSDGGIFATKPYICGSNYLLKMSDFRKGEWCDVVDGLYWRFIQKHRAFFSLSRDLRLCLGRWTNSPMSVRKGSSLLPKRSWVRTQNHTSRKAMVSSLRCPEGRPLRAAVVGASGGIGSQLVSVLAENSEVGKVFAFSRSALHEAPGKHGGH